MKKNNATASRHLSAAGLRRRTTRFQPGKSGNQSVHRLLLAAAAGSILAVYSTATATAAEAQSRPEITSRSQWRAKPPIATRMKRQTPREIVIHHTSVRQQPKISLERKLRGLQSYSQRRKHWGDAPYHYYIGTSGRIGKGRADEYAGDTNTRYNTANRIQIVLEGHFDREVPNKQQITALKRLVAWLSRQYGIPGDRVSGHNEHTPTDCPGRNLSRLLPTIRRATR